MAQMVALRGGAMALVLAVGTVMSAQSSAPAAGMVAGAPRFSALAPGAVGFATDGPVLRAGVQAAKPFTVAGPRGVLLGQQDGTLEAWVLPVKVLSHLRLEARVEGYALPVDVNQQAARIEVRPDRTTVTYSHIGFTVRQIMLSAPAASAAGRALAPATATAAGTGAAGPAVGPVVLFEFDCLRPTEFTFRFVPDVAWMWPQRGEGAPGVDWISPDPKNAAAAGGYYALGVDYPDLAAAVTIPGAEPGVISPYQERPRDTPVELKLRIDPKKDNGRLFPLLMAVGMNRADATQRALGQALERLNTEIPALYAAEAEGYRKLLANATRIETPDKGLDEAYDWAVVSIEQLKTTVPETARPKELGAGPAETALVAGYLNSSDSVRPGFGWFFGRDALYTLYAVDGYGDFKLARQELEFLIHRQRADGKIMHEFSQTAAAVDWAQFPYQWAAADATPLFLLAMADYVRASGDADFLREQRTAVEKAWAFETDPAHDTDHDGIYDNSQGTGWVESWPGGMPHQEIYMALLDQQASSAYAFLETQLKDEGKAHAAQERAGRVAKAINAEYHDADKSCYAFSRNLDGSQDRTRTIYPAMAWWDPEGGRGTLEHGDECLREFVGSGLNTDWGTRDVAADEPIYDGMSYHQGTVWPLFTGWAALAEYRGGQPLAGYQLLKENALLTRAQDLGSDTELLSGDYFVPTPRSTSHQLWSSAMVITPALRGLFGLSVDATTRTITVNPRLPAGWDEAEVRNVAVGAEKVDLIFHQSGNQTSVSILKPEAHAGVHLVSSAAGAHAITPASVAVPRALVAIGAFFEAPLAGARTTAARVVHEQYAPGKLVLELEGLAGSEMRLPVMLARAGLKLKAENATLADYTVRRDTESVAATQILIARFPQGSGFQRMTVTLSW